MAAQAAAAAQKEIMYLNMLHSMQYEGNTPVEGFLKKFELARNQLMPGNQQTVPDIVLLCLSAALHDPINSPAKGQDGMAFVGPSTQLDEKEPTEVDTYDKLKAKLEIMFAPTIKTSTQIINKIQTIKYSPDNTVQELITEIDKIVGRACLEKYAYQTLLMERVPLSIAKKLTDSDPEWRDLELSDLKKKLIAYNAAHRNPDPILRRREDLDVEKCWNCSELGQSTSACPDARRNWNECERLTQQKGISADEKYESRLKSAKGNGWFTGEVQILQKASLSEPRGSVVESDDECTFMYSGLDYSINGFTATVNNNEVDKKPAKETFIQKVSRELKQLGIYPARGRPNARRGDSDTLCPEPDERGYLPGLWDSTEWLKLRNRDIWPGTPEEPFKSLFEEAVPQGIDAARQIIDAAISYGPSIRMAAFVETLYLHDLLVDCGAEVTLITLSLAQKILEANPEMSIKYDRSLNIRGVAGKTTTKGYLVAELDFGQGVKVKEVLYILGENILNTELLISKLFLASINAMISMRHDYMMVPTLQGVPVIIHGNKVRGISELEKTNTKEVEKKKPSMEEVEDEAFAAESMAKKMIEFNEWRGSVYVNSEEFKGIIAPILEIPGFEESKFEEVSSEEVTISQAQAYERLVAGGYTGESAKEEGLEKLQVDNVTWWVCMEDITKVQKKRLVDLLRSMRPWVALRLAEMRHCSPERCQPILRPLPKAVWKKARYRRPFSPKDMWFITRHCAEMCAIEEPILHRATLVDIIEQTSTVVLASKGGNVDPRMCLNYVYLNS
ncbi:hypothetical protein K440DRAFT_636187 [Wilcoxina mikolae CBS 423.85]|nr:hypothetical protein K440DRAFT_636187 [Wilcoxina mikolae CBS 423.85]